MRVEEVPTSQGMWAPLAAEAVRKRLISCSFQKEPALPTPGLQPRATEFHLQNFERIKVHGFNPLNLWELVTTATET